MLLEQSEYVVVMMISGTIVVLLPLCFDYFHRCYCCCSFVVASSWLVYVCEFCVMMIGMMRLLRLRLGLSCQKGRHSQDQTASKSWQLSDMFVRICAFQCSSVSSCPSYYQYRRIYLQRMILTTTNEHGSPTTCVWDGCRFLLVLLWFFDSRKPNIYIVGCRMSCNWLWREEILFL